jgi:hypothetical protein
MDQLEMQVEIELKKSNEHLEKAHSITHSANHDLARLIVGKEKK